MAKEQIPLESPDLQQARAVSPLPEQKQFFKIPARFGHVPVAEEPLGYDRERRFEHHYPRIELPFQLVDTVETGVKKRFDKSELFPNGMSRLFFGDCLHVMRMLPSDSIDLIYIDPPFFSGRNYNILFGDKNEVRSFSDIWEGGMPGYLIWLNTRLFEMKRLLKLTGSMYVHLDWRAIHYVKCEMDRIFGCENFRNMITWKRQSGVSNTAGNQFPRNADYLLYYTRSERNIYNRQFGEYRSETLVNYRYDDHDGRGPYRLRDMRDYSPDSLKRFEEEGRVFKGPKGGLNLKQYLSDKPGITIDSVWADIKDVSGHSEEAVGYPTQKPEALLERLITASSNRGCVIADFFCGGGTTLSVAQKLGRRWIGCDISRVAVALTADRIARIMAPNLGDMNRAKRKEKPDERQDLLLEVTSNSSLTSVEESKKKALETSGVPMVGYSVEHWGIYEINRLTKLPPEAFREFVIKCYGARKWTGANPDIHGVKANELIWVGGPKETDLVTAVDVKRFAESVIKSRKPDERQAIMIGWGIDPKAREYAQQITALGEKKPILFVRLKLWPLAGEELKGHVTRKNTKYKDFFAFILPPEIPRIAWTRLGAMKYRFDVSEARSMNSGGHIVNVQWDFDFRDGIFSATSGYQLCRKETKGSGDGGFEGDLVVEYEFEDVKPGTEVSIACRVQDDVGGEGLKTMTLKVE